MIPPYKFGFVLSVLISIFDSAITFPIELAGRVCQSSLLAQVSSQHSVAVAACLHYGGLVQVMLMG